MGENNHTVVARESRRVELVGQLLGAGCEIAQTGIEWGMKGGDERHLQLLAQFRQPEIEGGQRETCVNDVGFDPLERIPQFPLCSRRWNRVDLRLDQIGKADVRVIRQKGGTAPLRALWIVEMDEMGLVTTLSEQLGGRQPIGHIPAERRFLPKPGDLRQTFDGPIRRNGKLAALPRFLDESGKKR